LLVYQDRKYGAVSYSALTAADEPTQFIEADGVPGDAEVVGQTWRFVNRDGGPDRRFNNNRRIPIARYGNSRFNLLPDCICFSHTSKVQSAQEFAARLTGALGGFRHQTRPGSARAGYSSDSVVTALRVLGLDATATADEIKVAYRRMAVIYHPDKVAQMDPRFRALAEERMKDLNSAYAILSGTI
jgi:hypothetical protein